MEEYSPDEPLSAIDELFNAIEDEIRAEYQVLNKFSTEKFSIILILLGFFGVAVSAWPTIRTHIDLSEFFFLWIISICIFLLYWAFSLFHATWKFLNNKSPKSVSIEIIKRKISEFVSIILLILKFNENEEDGQSKEDLEKKMRSYIAEMKSFVLFFIDFVAKNTEMKMRPILIFFLFLIISSWVHIEGYFEVSIPGLTQLIPLTNIPLVLALLLYAILFCLLGFWWGGILAVLSWWGKLLAKGFDLFTIGVVAWQNSRAMKNILGDLLYKLKNYSVGFVKILSGGLLVIIWALPLLCILAFILRSSQYSPDHDDTCQLNQSQE